MTTDIKPGKYVPILNCCVILPPKKDRPETGHDGRLHYKTCDRVRCNRSDGNFVTSKEAADTQIDDISKRAKEQKIKSVKDQKSKRTNEPGDFCRALICYNCSLLS